MADVPTKVVIDCSVPNRDAVIAYTQDQVAAVLKRRTDEKITSDEAATLLVALAELAAEATTIPDSVTIVPLEGDELAEHDYQRLNPDAMQAALKLADLGHVCTRPTPGADVFECDGTTYSAKTLLAYAEKRADEPSPPTIAEKVAAAVAAAPELSAATKQALQDALA